MSRRLRCSWGNPLDGAPCQVIKHKSYFLAALHKHAFGGLFHRAPPVVLRLQDGKGMIEESHCKLMWVQLMFIDCDGLDLVLGTNQCQHSRLELLAIVGDIIVPLALGLQLVRSRSWPVSTIGSNITPHGTGRIRCRYSSSFLLMQMNKLTRSTDNVSCGMLCQTQQKKAFKLMVMSGHRKMPSNKKFRPCCVRPVEKDLPRYLRTAEGQHEHHPRWSPICMQAPCTVIMILRRACASVFDHVCT